MNHATFPIDVLARWVHVGTVVALVGGTAFVRFVLLPAAEQLDDSARATLHEAVTARWKRFVHAGIVLILLSGLYNYARGAAVHQGDSLYHALIGTKILLALGVFFLASALVGRSAAFETLRRNRRLWLGVVVALAAVIIAISGFVKVRGVRGAPAAQSRRQKVEVSEQIAGGTSFELTGTAGHRGEWPDA